MADRAQNLRTFILGDANIAQAVAARVEQNHVPQDFDGDRIWFSRSSTVYDDCIDMSAGSNVIQENFDIECVSNDLDKAQSLAEYVKARLNDYRGTFGTETIQGCFCSDHNDDYLPRSVSGDDGLFVAAMNVEVHPR